MLTIILALLAFGFLMFVVVIAFGAPYLPTLRSRVDDAFELLDLKKGQTLLELGCGDGIMLHEAAQRGIKAVGYELNPILFFVAKVRCWRYRKTVKIKWGNYWTKKWPDADGIYVFLLQSYMSKLHNKVTHRASKKPLNLVSHAFQIEEKKQVRELNGMFLYKY